MRFAGKYRIIHGIIGLKIVNVVLIHYFKADEERTRLRETVEITGIAELALIQVLLETVEYILHTGVQLELDVVVQHEGIVELQVEVEELGAWSPCGLPRYTRHSAAQSSCPYKCRTVRSRNSSPAPRRK